MKRTCVIPIFSLISTHYPITHTDTGPRNTVGRESDCRSRGCGSFMAQSHTFMEIDLEIISIDGHSVPSSDSRRVVVSY